MNDFFDKYDAWVIPEPMSGCFLWFGSWTTAGYGNFTRRNRTHYAHRSAYEWRHGPGSAEGMVVRHRCDNKCCCNPDHLEIGTHKDNSDDAWKRGLMRPAVGERASKASITEEIVLRARALARQGMPICDVAAALGLVWSVVDKAVRGVTWRHLPDPVETVAKAGFRTEVKRGEQVHTAKLTRGQVDEIRSALKAGVSGPKLAAAYNVSKPTIYAIKSGRNWAQ